MHLEQCRCQAALQLALCGLDFIPRCEEELMVNVMKDLELCCLTVWRS